MKRRKRTAKVTIETERTLIFRNSSRLQEGWCVACGSKAQMTTVIGAAREAGLSELAIYQLLEVGAIHMSADSDGRILICINSLMK
jgi:hypothetical protein